MIEGAQGEMGGQSHVASSGERCRQLRPRFHRLGSGCAPRIVFVPYV